jgi:hypothetical protein
MQYIDLVPPAMITRSEQDPTAGISWRPSACRQRLCFVAQTPNLFELPFGLASRTRLSKQCISPRACAATPTTSRRGNARENARLAAAPEFSVPLTGICVGGAPSVRGTLVLTIPSTPAHLVDSAPAAHSLDADGYVLAVSVVSERNAADGVVMVWARGRFVRTRAFFRERRLGKRVYMGQHGTPGMGGMAAPLRPKQASNAGVAVWGVGKKRKLFVFGDGGLPMTVDIATLATKGTTALGTVLTDMPELAETRGSEISADTVVTPWGTLAVCSRARGPAGRVTGMYISEIDENFEKVAMSQKLSIPANAHIAAFCVSKTHYVVAMYKIIEGGGMSSNPFSKWFGGRSKDAESGATIDTEHGTLVMLVPIAASPVHGAASGSTPDVTRGDPTTFRLPNLLVTSCASAFSTSYTSSSPLVLEFTAIEGRIPLSVCRVADVVSGQTGGEAPRSSVWRCVVAVPPSGDCEVGDLTELAKSQPEYSFQARCLSVYEGLDGRRILSSATNEADGTSGIASLDTSNGNLDFWRAAEPGSGVCVSRPCLTSDGKHVAALVSGSVDGLSDRVVVLDVANVEAGPVIDISLDNIQLGSTTGAAWCDDVFTWDEYGGKLPTSAYEMFEDKNWNDINSGFSSLGLNQ